MRNFIAPLFAAFAASVAAADPTPPGFEFLYTVNATLSPALEFGAGPQGDRKAIPIIGGEVPRAQAERLVLFLFLSLFRKRRKVLNLGADWGLTDQYGTFHPDTRYHFQTDDGANIFIRTSGPAQKDGTIHLHCLLETGHPDYYWVNNVVAVGILNGGDGYVVIDVWQLTSPAAP
ncbi:hypothetical protein PG994_006395 [Apiospora phragmitis]|uniref:Uncharacterized protein n=1 Tax=Apiospora phragmitis TaxID=2905665 RepID=A0ABR1VEY3_9PEZI